MASSPVEFINRRSTPTTSNSYKKDVKGYLHSWQHPSSESENSKTQNNVDLSWLPDYCHTNFANGSDNLNHQNGQNESDDSWLPNYDDSKKNASKPVAKSSNSNPSRRKTTDSGLPSTPIVKNGSKNRGQIGFQGSKSDSRKTECISDLDDSWLPDTKKNSSTPVSKSNNSNNSRENENGLDDSWLPSTPIVKNENKNNVQNHSHNSRRLPNHNPTKKNGFTKPKSSNCSKQTDSNDSWLPPTNHNQSRNHNHHEKVLNKKPESSRSQGQTSPCISECSVETDSLGGVSTLLRKWKDLAETTNSKHSSASKTESMISTESNNNNQTKVFDSSENCASSRTTTTDYSESCKTSPSTPLSSLILSQDSKAMNHVEKEKIRVVDIVKKLSNEEELAAINNTLDCVTENKCFSPVICKTRLIRGRQAFKDFLQLMEQDKRRELEILTQRKPVSKFPNRGRIQAVLRVRFIRLGSEPQKETKSYKRSVSKTMKTIWDKFSTGVKHGSSASRKVNNNETTIREAKMAAATNQELESTTTSNQSTHSIDTSSHLIQTKQDSNSKIEVADKVEYHEKNQVSENMFSSEIEEKRLDDSIQGGLEDDGHWISEYPQSQSDWDEDEYEEEEYYYNYNWIRDVARPRSDWECMRQKRYQEMLHLYSYNPDIQQLLQRRSVSDFLSSDLRNNLDKLMVSRAQVFNNERIQETKYKEEEEDGGKQECSEYKEFIDQTTCYSTSTQSPTPEERSWSHPHVIYDPDQSQSQSQSRYQSQSPSPSQSVVNPYLQLQNNTRQSLSFNQPSIEMELIYELKGQLEQLQQEIMELRNHVNMQQSVEKKRSGRISAKQNCCVCYEIQADSFLYRCGHMCTCYDCGLKLLCSSKKCPICEALIVDVVRAYGYDECVTCH